MGVLKFLRNNSSSIHEADPLPLSTESRSSSEEHRNAEQELSKGVHRVTQIDIPMDMDVDEDVEIAGSNPLFRHDSTRESHREVHVISENV